MHHGYLFVRSDCRGCLSLIAKMTLSTMTAVEGPGVRRLAPLLLLLLSAASASEIVAPAALLGSFVSPSFEWGNFSAFQTPVRLRAVIWPREWCTGCNVANVVRTNVTEGAALIFCGEIGGDSGDSQHCWNECSSDDGGVAQLVEAAGGAAYVSMKTNSMKQPGYRTRFFFPTKERRETIKSTVAVEIPNTDVTRTMCAALRKGERGVELLLGAEKNPWVTFFDGPVWLIWRLVFGGFSLTVLAYNITKLVAYFIDSRFEWGAKSFPYIVLCLEIVANTQRTWFLLYDPASARCLRFIELKPLLLPSYAQAR